VISPVVSNSKKHHSINGGLQSKDLAPAGIPLLTSADGHVHLTVSFDPRDANFIIQSKMRLVPAAPGIPVSGEVDLTYHQRGNSLEFGHSQMNFQNSQLSFAGPLTGELQLTLDSSNLNDFKPLLDAASAALPAASQPQLLAGGSAHFNGTLGNIDNPEVDGQIALLHFRAQGQIFDRLSSHISATANGTEFQSLELQQGSARLTGHGTLGMRNWFVHGDSPRAGYGPGLTVIMASTANRIHPVVRSGRNIAELLGLRTSVETAA
jgi:hypothetical protein